MRMPKIKNSKALFENLCCDKFKELYDSSVPESFQTRLASELNIILEHNQEVPHLVAKHIIDESFEMGYQIPSIDKHCLSDRCFCLPESLMLTQLNQRVLLIKVFCLTKLVELRILVIQVIQFILIEQRI